MAIDIEAGLLADHNQLYLNSCIPMCVELVLKHLEIFERPNSTLQHGWDGEANKTFGAFEGKAYSRTVGLMDRFYQTKTATFHHTGTLEPGALRALINQELDAGRLVIVSLKNPPQNGDAWHMWVVYDRRADCSFDAVSKTFNEQGVLNWRTATGLDLMTRAQDTGGSDALTYTLTSQMAQKADPGAGAP